MWADLQRLKIDEHAQLVTWLTKSERAEQGLFIQIQQILPTIPYEQFRQRLEVMARDDDQHATLIYQRLQMLGTPATEPARTANGSANNLPSGPWHRLQRVLTDKRELYEGYRQGASVVEDAALRSLLERLRDDEARHQEEIIEMLMRLDAHVHETIA